MISLEELYPTTIKQQINGRDGTENADSEMDYDYDDTSDNSPSISVLAVILLLVILRVVYEFAQ